MKLTLNRLTLRHFLSYELQAIDFPLQGMVLLQGPSGAGKSAIMQGIAYAFGFNSVPANKLTRWGAVEGASVSVDGYLDATDKFTLIRGTDISAALQIGEIQYQGNANVKNVLQGRLGVSPEFLSELTYRPQQEPGSFVRKTDSEKKEFLTQVLGLQKFEKAVEAAQLKLQELNVETAQYSVRLDNFKLAVESAEAEMEKYPMPEPLDPYYTTAIEDAQAEVDVANAGHSMRRFLLSKTSLAEDTPDILMNTNVRKVLEANRTDWTVKTAAAEKAAKQEGALRLKYDQVTKRYNALSENKCVTCGQDWQNIEEWHKARMELVELEGEIAEVEKSVELAAEGKEQIKKLTSAIDDITKEISDLQMANQQAYIALEKAVGEAQNDLNTKQNKRDKLRWVFELAQEKYNKAYELRTGATNRLALAQNNEQATQTHLDMLDKKVCEEADFVFLVGNQGFLGAIFEEVLLQIAAEANSILSQVPNTANVEIAFATETTTQGGKQKKAITLNVSVNGNSTTLQAGLSGGMKTVVMLATDLAVGKVVAQRSGLSPNWLILDEPFDGLDSYSREAMLEMLAKEAQEKVIIVVDHSVDTSGMFQTVYKVSQTNGISTVDTMK